MKRIIYKLVLVMICIYAGMVMSGCAALFDALNFNRHPLPDVHGDVDGSLVDGYPQSGEVIEDSVMDALFAASLEDRVTYKDELKISVDLPSSNYNLFDYSLSLSTVERYSDEDEVSKDDPYITYPYARFVEERDYPYALYSESIDLFNNHFYVLHMNKTFAYDDDLNEDNFLPSYYLNAGGIFAKALGIIQENYVEARHNYTNGREVYMLNFDDSVISSMLEFLPSYFVVTSDWGSFSGIAPLTLLISDGKIVGTEMKLHYSNGYVISLTFSTEEISYKFQRYGLSSYSLPSHIYLIKALDANQNIDRTIYYIRTNQYKMTVDLQVSDAFEANSSFVYYSLYYKNVNLLVLEFDDRILYRFGSYYMFESKDGVISMIDYYTDEYNDYRRIFEEMRELGDEAYDTSFADTFSIEEHEDKYMVSASFVGYAYYEKQLTMDKEFTKAFYVEFEYGYSAVEASEYEEARDKEIRQKGNLTFEYNPSIIIPSKVLSYI